MPLAAPVTKATLPGKRLQLDMALPQLGVDGSCFSRSRIMTFRGRRARSAAIRHSQSGWHGKKARRRAKRVADFLGMLKPG
jgi:hypothetical protein